MMYSAVYSSNIYAAENRIDQLSDRIPAEKVISAVKDTLSAVKDTILNDSIQKDSKFSILREKFVDQLSAGKNPDYDKQHDTVPHREEKILSGFLTYQGKVIRKIGFKQLEIFGQDVDDTTKVPTKWLENLGNELHINTQPYVLKNRLLVFPGDTVDLYMLSENERLIRELPFVEDARIIIQEVTRDSVDLIFITKDVMPVGGSIELLDVVYGKASVSNTNVLGMGHELYYHLTWNYDRIPFYGHKVRYKIQNIGNTFFTLDASYENQWNMEAFRFSCNRDFFSQGVHYAGGVYFEKINSVKDIIFPDTTLENIDIDYNYYDLWLGRALPINSLSSGNKKANIVATGRIIRYEFFERPEVEEELLYDYHERIDYLVSLGISQVGYQKATKVYGFGRREDIPFGTSLTLTAGLELNEFYNRPYFGIRFAWGNVIKRIGYLYHRIEYGTFLNYGIEQGLLIYRMNYFSPLLNSTGRFSYRIFTNLTYKSGYNRFGDEYMEFSRTDGIRGLYSNRLRGNQRMNLSLENVCYSPHHLLGFRFVYFTFFDAGIITNTHAVLIRNRLYTGFGAGIRIRNENLIFDTVLLRFGYYPLLPENASPEYVKLTSTANPRLDNFIIQRPEIIRY